MVVFYVSWEQLPGTTNETTDREERRLSFLKMLSLITPPSETPASVKQLNSPESVLLTFKRTVVLLGVQPVGQAVPRAANVSGHLPQLSQAVV